MADWEAVKRILGQALDRPPEERADYLASACAGDGTLLQEVKELLSHRGRAGSFLTPPAPDGGAVGQVLADRYRMERVLGCGGFGSVYDALDLVSGSRVAVKVLRGPGGDVSPEFRREVATLRWLRLPGVVRLLDEGMAGERAFVVMELVDGSPFPGGAGRQWESLQETAVALLETIARIHWAGVIHCDLKPNNVLVRADGVPVVLDLGISSGPAVDGALATPFAFAGTPRYAAPERLRGDPATERSDLFSYGVMLFEALTGCVPGPEGAPLAPDVPDAVAALVGRLISPDPCERPASAAEALSVLLGTRDAEELPRLGGMGPVEALAAAALTGRSADVAGPEGSGRTRCLREAAEALRARGREVVFVAPAEAPFESLAPFLSDLPRTAGLEDARHEVACRLQARLVRGDVLVVDERIDRWSADAIEACRGHGAVLRARPDADRADVVLEPLAPSDLRGLFAGADRVHHLREDAAQELRRRTGGHPAAVASEIAAWVRAGIARRDAGRIVVTRAALEQLRLGLGGGLSPATGRPPAPPLFGRTEDVLQCVEIARDLATADLIAAALDLPLWSVEADLADLARSGCIRPRPGGGFDALVAPARAASAEALRRIHGALADAMAPGPERLQHLLAARRLEDVVAEAPEVARALLASGRVWAAETILLEGLRALHASADSSRDEVFLPQLLACALAEGTSTSLDLVLYYCARSRVSSRRLVEVEAISRAAQLAIQGDGARALALLERKAWLDDETLERARQSVRAIAAAYVEPARHEEVVRDGVRWAEGRGEPSLRALGLEWRGWLLYREGRFGEAARMHEEAAATTREAYKRTACLLGAAWASLDGGDFGRARDLACRARALAADCRHAHYEARAEALERSAAYRAGDHGAPDLELVEALELLGAGLVHGVALLTEAAVAWRTRSRGLGRVLAARAAERLRVSGEPAGAVLARCLALACGGSEDPLELERLACDCPMPGIALQALALLAHAGRALGPAALAAARRCAQALPKETETARREVVSPREALQWISTKMEGRR